MLAIVFSLMFTLGVPSFVVHNLQSDYAIVEIANAGLYRVTPDTLTAVKYELAKCANEKEI